MCNDQPSTTIESSFEDHFVVRILHLRSPVKEDTDWLNDTSKSDQKRIGALIGQAMNGTLLIPPNHHFIFEEKCGSREHLKLSRKSHGEKLVACPVPAA